MNYTFSSEQISRTVNIDSNLITRQNKLELIAMFLEINYVNPSLRQDQKTNKLGCSSSTLHRYRQDIYLLSTYRISSNTHKRRQKISNTFLHDN